MACNNKQVACERTASAFSVGDDGSLILLTNPETGWNYSGGAGLWRLYYNTPEEKEIKKIRLEEA